MDFEDKSESQQFRIAAKVRKLFKPPAIILAASQSFRRLGHFSAAKVVGALQKNPDLGSDLWNFLKKRESGLPQPISVPEALGILFDRSYSKAQFMDYRQDVNEAAGFLRIPE